MSSNFNGNYNQYNNNINRNNESYNSNNQCNSYNRQNYIPYNYDAYQSSGRYSGSNAFTFGLISLVLSAFTFCLTPTVSLVFGILAIAESNRAKKFMCVTSKTNAGKIMGILGIVLSVVRYIFLIILFIVFCAAYPRMEFFY